MLALLPMYGQTASIAGIITDTSTIAGIITDTSSREIAGAEISPKRTATGAKRGIETGDSGSYSVPDLAPGSYRITISSPGFATTSYDNVQLTVGQRVVLNCVLEFGQVSQSISVSGDTLAPIDLDNAQLSNSCRFEKNSEFAVDPS